MFRHYCCRFFVVSPISANFAIQVCVEYATK